MFDQSPISPNTPAVYSSANPFAGIEVIYSYSREEAISDGVLIDLRAVEPDVCNERFGPNAALRPIVCTVGVWDIIHRAVENKKHLNDLDGVMHDIFWMSRGVLHAIHSRGESRGAEFGVIITGAGRTRNHRLVAHLEIVNGAAGAVTYTLPGED